MTSTQLAIEGGQPVRERFLPFGAPCLDDEEIQEVVDTLRSGWIGTGPKTVRFEGLFAEYVGAKHALAVNSCTAALHLSFVTTGIGPGDEVIVPALTFAATANSVIHAGGTPVFADIDAATLNISPAAIERAITPRTRAIVPVHFGGLACDMDAIGDIAARHGLTVIEDAAHALGTRYAGKLIGTFGKLTCFSFYANKNLSTAEGGMVTTEDDELADRIAVYRLHGLSKHAWQRYASKKLMLSETMVPGFKYNLTDIASSLGIHQLAKQERFLQRREEIAAFYDRCFGSLPGVRLITRPTDPAYRHALHLYVLLFDPRSFRVTRNEILQALLAENIGAALHYRALHTHEYYRENFGYAPDDFPVSHEVGERILSLPLTPCMSDDDAQSVVDAVTKVCAAYRE